MYVLICIYQHTCIFNVKLKIYLRYYRNIKCRRDCIFQVIVMDLLPTMVADSLPETGTRMVIVVMIVLRSAMVAGGTGWGTTTVPRWTLTATMVPQVPSHHTIMDGVVSFTTILKIINLLNIQQWCLDEHDFH